MTNRADKSPTAPAARSVLQVVRGAPTAAELAALIAVVSAYASPAGEASEPTVVSAWSAPAAGLRQPLHPDAGAWFGSGWQAGVRTSAAW